VNALALTLDESVGLERDRARFLQYADRPSARDCWLWQAHCERYGRFSIGLRKVWAHRAAWLLWRGDVPQELYVLHTCDVKTCVNPRHLYLGTHADNVRDAVARRRYRRGFRVTHCPRGHDLTEHGRINSQGNRECRTCRNAQKRVARAERKALDA
jgi:hypothetical protein